MQLDKQENEISINPNTLNFGYMEDAQKTVACLGNLKNSSSQRLLDRPDSNRNVFVGRIDEEGLTNSAS